MARKSAQSTPRIKWFIVPGQYTVHVHACTTQYNLNYIGGTRFSLRILLSHYIQRKDILKNKFNTS